jgi:hypothetical protein
MRGEIDYAAEREDQRQPAGNPHRTGPGAYSPRGGPILPNGFILSLELASKGLQSVASAGSRSLRPCRSVLTR